uniref:Ovule protein n=1 Tax=Romanomermis culicivorax TaxID=13658 RepID=A0A915KIP1_ROMCU
MVFGTQKSSEFHSNSIFVLSQQTLRLPMTSENNQSFTNQLLRIINHMSFIILLTCEVIKIATSVD